MSKIRAVMVNVIFSFATCDPEEIEMKCINIFTPPESNVTE